jgi:hypothetical protein
MFPSDRVVQLYPQAPGSLFVILYDLWGYSGGNYPAYTRDSLNNNHTEVLHVSSSRNPLKTTIFYHGQSQWPRGQKHEMSSPAQTLGSWIRIPLEAWMFVCVYSVFVLSYICR